MKVRDPAQRKANFDALRCIAADPLRHKQFLLRTSLIDSVRKAAKIN